MRRGRHLSASGGSCSLPVYPPPLSCLPLPTASRACVCHTGQLREHQLHAPMQPKTCPRPRPPRSPAAGASSGSYRITHGILYTHAGLPRLTVHDRHDEDGLQPNNRRRTNANVNPPWTSQALAQALPPSRPLFLVHRTPGGPLRSGKFLWHCNVFSGHDLVPLRLGGESQQARGSLPGWIQTGERVVVAVNGRRTRVECVCPVAYRVPRWYCSVHDSEDSGGLEISNG